MVFTRRICWLHISLMASLIVTCCFAGRGIDQRIRCNPPDAIPNGNFKLRRNNMLLRINCNSGYWLNGNRIIDCINGKWYGEKSVCAKKGCKTDIKNPENGNIQIISEYKAMLFCNQNYILVGNRFAYCNGTHWDRQIGECRKKNSSNSLYCDFEPEDSCGWVYQTGNIYYWKRVMAGNMFKSYHTGPMHDHTTHNAYGGHYMLMEDWGARHGETIKLISPIYSLELTANNDSCFQFYYFMYGIGIGTLYVYIMPVTANLKNLETDDKIYQAIKISGHQNNFWNEAHFKVPKMSEDFQIIFVATEGLSHFSDIAIDDVRLYADQNCTGLQNVTNKEISSEHVTEETITASQSCESRCGEKQLNKGAVSIKGELIVLCNCHPECQIEDSCCLDYVVFCLEDLFTDTTEYIKTKQRNQSMGNETVQFTSTNGNKTILPQESQGKKVINETSANITISTTTQQYKTTFLTTVETEILPTVMQRIKSITEQTTKASVTTLLTIPPTTATTKLNIITQKKKHRTTPTIIPVTQMSLKNNTSTNSVELPTTLIFTEEVTKSTSSPILPKSTKIISILKYNESILHSNNSDKGLLRKHNLKTWNVLQDYSNLNSSDKNSHKINLFKIVPLLIVCTIIIGVIYRYKSAIIEKYNNNCNYSDEISSGDIETTSIVAKFSQTAKYLNREAPLNTLLSKTRKRLARSRGELGTPFCANEIYENDYNNINTMPQNKNSSEL